jgi:hypothetical protein
MKLCSIFFLFIFLLSCNRMSDKRKIELWRMMKSNNVDSIIQATIEIQKAKDTGMIDAILYGADDPRITHNARHKGMSVYQIKMSALKRVTGLLPPKKITYKVDTTVINFYLRVKANI